MKFLIQGEDTYDFQYHYLYFNLFYVNLGKNMFAVKKKVGAGTSLMLCF